MSGTIISEQKKQQQIAWMAELHILETDIEEQFVRGSGKGGQKVNKTSSCVQLVHKPSGIVVKCQKGRSQAANRFFARRELCERIAESIEGKESERQQKIERIKRQKRRRSRRQKERMLDEKKKQGEKKEHRRRVDIHRD